VEESKTFSTLYINCFSLLLFGEPGEPGEPGDLGEEDKISVRGEALLCIDFCIADGSSARV